MDCENNITTDVLISVVGGSIRENVVNIPCISIYGVRYDPDIKVFLRNLYEYGKFSGIDEYKKKIINMFNF